MLKAFSITNNFVLWFITAHIYTSLYCPSVLLTHITERNSKMFKKKLPSTFLKTIVKHPFGIFYRNIRKKYKNILYFTCWKKNIPPYEFFKFKFY